jgi:aspartate 1-decarboxylase
VQRNLLKSKIHRATVTAAELHYEGSCAIDLDLLEAADIREFERVEIWNVSNGARLNTYAIVAERGSGTISLNGSAARQAQVGDLVIIATFADYTEDEARSHQPRLVFVDERNRQKELRRHVPVQKD